MAGGNIFEKLETSLVGQWLRLYIPNAGGPGSIPGQGTRSHMPQLKVCTLQLKIPYATTKTRTAKLTNLKNWKKAGVPLERKIRRMRLKEAEKGRLGPDRAGPSRLYWGFESVSVEKWIAQKCLLRTGLTQWDLSSGKRRVVAMGKWIRKEESETTAHVQETDNGSLDQWFSNWEILPLRKHLAMSGDIFGCSTMCGGMSLAFSR